MQGGREKVQTYTVLAHIIEARDLKPRSRAGMSDPVVQVEAFGKAQATPVVKKDMSPWFDHFMHWETQMDPQQFERERILISVFDASTFLRKEKIGVYEFDAAAVYAQPNHEYLRTWVVLVDNTDKVEGVQGYLKLSLTVLKPGDVPADHPPDEDENDGEEENLQNMVLLRPKGLNAEDYHLLIRAFEAEDIPKMDNMLGSCDPFITAYFAATRARTSVKENTLVPKWNEEMQIPVTMPCLSDTITFTVLDADKAGKDEIIATSYLSYKQYFNNPATAAPFYLNLYGSKANNQKLAKGLAEGTDYRGRALLSLETMRVQDPKAGTVPVRMGANKPATTPYTLQFNIYEGAEIPSSKNIYAVVSIGPHSRQSSKRPVKNGIAGWYEAVADIDVAYPTDISQVPDIFVYLYEDVVGDDKRIGYRRFKASELVGQNLKPTWTFLKEDPSDPVAKDAVPGFLQIGLNFGPSAQLKAAPRAEIRPPQKKTYELRAHVFMGRNLAAGDENGLSDPYVSLRMGGTHAKTKVKENTIQPDWFETVVMLVDLAPLDQAADLHLLVYDWDKMTVNDDFLGRCVIPASACSTGPQPPEPKWYPLFIDSPNDPWKGELLVGVQLLPVETAASVPMPNLLPATRECEVEVGVVSLRNLAPFQLLPIQNAFVRVRVSGQKEPLKIFNTNTSSRPNGSNPVFAETVTVPVSIPENPLFQPVLQLDIIDARPLGNNCLIGNVSVPLASYIPWTNVPADKSGLPPPVNDTALYQPPGGASSSLAGALGVPKAGGAAAPTHTVIDVNDTPHETGPNERAPLLSTAATVAPVRDVQETVVPGMEEEPEPPAREEVPHEIEHFLRRLPFVEYNLLRGKSRGSISDLFFAKRKVHAPRSYGRVKTQIRVVESSKRQQVPPLDLSKMLQPRPYVCRVYVEQGVNLTPMDDDGKSDPYLKLSVGKGKEFSVDGKEHVQRKTLQPNFWKCYTLRGQLPAQNELTVQAWDLDDKSPTDDLVGETKYDLEGLWWSDEWRALNPKPKENRALWSPLSTNPQGKLRMWVELLTPDEAARIPETPIGPPEKQNFELRIVVWETRNVTPKDRILGKDSSDQVVWAKLVGHPNTLQKTDVHQNVMDGCGKFNWRIVYKDVMLPFDVPRLKLQIYDNERIGPNDAIAEANLNLKGFFQKAKRNKGASIRAQLPPAAGAAAGAIAATGAGPSNAIGGGPQGTGQWLDLYHPSFQGPQGTIALEIDCIPREDASARPAAPGRGEPNQFPFLPEPVRPKRDWLGDLAKFLKLDKLKTILIIVGVVLILVMILSLAIKFS